MEEADLEPLGVDLDPEVDALRKRVFKLHGGLSQRRYKRAQIINRKLVLAALEKVDLSEYEGCQLIDMNPGFGVFSEEIHRIVKPSKHILLEPNSGFHEILKETLIDNPPLPGHECQTTILSDDGYEWDTYENLITEKIIEPEYVDPKDGVNTKILFIANLAMKGNDGDRMCTQIMDSIGTRTWLQKYGRVRMMVWVPDSIKIRFLPRMMRDRTKVTVTSEICAEVQELAGGGYYDDATTWNSTIKLTTEALIKGLKELDEKRAKGIITTAPGEIVTERRKGADEAALENFELTPEEQAEEDALYSKKKEEAMTLNTQKKHKAIESDKESFLGIAFRGELESLYARPGHKPWTPELEHPPWVYDDHPELELERPPPRTMAPILCSTVGRLKKDGTRDPPKPIKPPTEFQKPLKQKTLRRMPFPNEFVLKNGYDAYILMEAYQKQKELDRQIAKWDEEANTPIEMLEEEEAPPEKKVTVKEQYMLASQAKEMGYKWTTMAKAGVIWKDLEADFGTEEAYVWMRAIGQTHRKRHLMEVLKEEIIGQSILQWNSRKFEPVPTTRDDVQPKEPIAFLDIVPKKLPDWLVAEGLDRKTRDDRWDLLVYILKNVFVIRASPIRESFATLAPGAEDVLQLVPSLAGDKAERLKTRMLTGEQYVELAEKFEAWPFRDKMAMWEDGLAQMEAEAEADQKETVKKYSENWA
ncbi:ribosomal RNA adenine dimethylase-domain-containing protein [Peziza echinospora]|nr:ribosomal RNA adenine dimethylase-domain-containing protein [Peziza echinospora]